MALYREFPNGHWRTEMVGAIPLNTSGWQGRSDDYFMTGSLEYGWPINPHIVTGIRTYPALIYYQDKNDQNESETIFGLSVGPALRIYTQKGTYQGLFFEAGPSLLWTNRLFRDNASHFNYLCELGAGYQFPSNWHTSVKYYHISNANMDSPNVGVNTISLTLGYTF